jgi:predicted nucleic acid-binding Zn ribbon protein
MKRLRNEHFTKISEILDSVLKRKGLGKKLKQHELFLRWEEIVGERLAKKAVPKCFQGETLIVVVNNAVWMSEMKFLKPRIIEKIQQLIHSVKIKDIRLIQGNPDAHRV